MTNERPSHYRRVRGWPSDTPFRGGPIFTLPLPIGPIVFITVISWFASLVIPSPFGPGPIFNDLAFVPVEFLVHWKNGEVLSALLPLFTHVLLHDPTGPGHLVLNMLWLMVFGSGIARRLCIPGTLAGERTHNVLVFLAFYLSSGAAGGLAHLATHTYETGPLIGASGAISGLMGGTLRFALRLFAPMGAEYGRLAPVWARPVLVASDARPDLVSDCAPRQAGRAEDRATGCNVFLGSRTRARLSRGGGPREC